MSQDDPIKQIDELTRIRTERREELIKYYSNMNEYQRSHLHELQKDILKNMGQLTETVLYVSLILALDKRHKTEHLTKSTEEITDDQQKVIERIKLDHFKGLRKTRKRKTSKLANELRLLKPVIEKLRKEGFSWRDIELYLQKYNRIKASFAYIRQIFEEDVVLTRNYYDILGTGQFPK